MLSRQCELVHRWYTADQETVPSCRSTCWFAGSRRFGARLPQNPTARLLRTGNESATTRLVRTSIGHPAVTYDHSNGSHVTQRH